ncbi:GINS complex, Psf3 component [Neoconidiobolus thromboides FSU 785]|nr:GINS complex, Psf3 component [Neoconidiobolus thromboides FSU 785]
MSFNNYFDEDEFLAEEQLIPCKFNQDVDNISHLIGTQDLIIHKDSQLSIPYWGAEQLKLEGYTETELPIGYQLKIRNGVLASPTNIDLSSINSQFYYFGRMVAHGLDEITKYEMIEYLNYVFIQRLTMIVDHSTTRSNLDQQAHAFLNQLDEFEKEVYKQAQRKNKEYLIWLTKKD